MLHAAWASERVLATWIVRIVAFEVIRSACRSEEPKPCESRRDVRKRVWREMRVGTRMAYCVRASMAR